jgi:pimeloyl-ACP methyl ester carboxylesterase
MTATVVLVHGAGSGAWTWRDVRAGLGGKGIESRAVDLPSCTNADPSVGLHEDAELVRSVIDDVGGNVVLVGNSYGGAVISEAAAGHPAVKRLVYLAAFMPVETEPLMQQLMGAVTEGFNDGVNIRDDGLIEFDLETELRVALQQAPPDQIEWVRANGARPMSFGSDPNLAPAAAAWETIPSTCVVCTEDLSIRPEAQREWAKTRAGDFVEWPSDHCPQHSHPDLVIDLLERLAIEHA